MIRIMLARRDAANAFTLVEILIAMVVVSILAGVGVATIFGVHEGSRTARLQNDVAVVNNAIDAYLAAGGTIPQGATAEQVLAKLKTVASSDSAAVGPSGPFIDPRLQLVMQTPDESATAQSRADYPNAAGYFYIRAGGGPGIREFASGAAAPLVTEVRQGTMAYTSEGGFFTPYTDTAVAAASAAAVPATVVGADEAAKAGKDLAKLLRPVLEVKYYGTSGFVAYNGESLKLSDIPCDVRLSSPIVSTAAQLRFAWDSNAMTATASPYIRTNFDIPPPPAATPFITAQVVSLDSTRYMSSDEIKVSFAVIRETTPPFSPEMSSMPSTITYLQAGGAMYVGGVLTSNARPPVTVSLSNIEKIPARYMNLLSGGLTATYTRRYTGSVDTLTNGSFSPAGGFQPGSVPIDVAGFGTATSIGIYAWVYSANPNLIVAGQPLSNSITIQTTPLAVDVLPLKPIGLPPSVTIPISGNYPSGVRRFYTLTQGSSGSPPLNPVSAGTNIPSAVLAVNGLVTGTPIATYTVVAQATGPAGTEHWFTCSPVNRTYIAITTVPLKYIGLNMFRANINGYVKGSIYMQAGDFAVLNAGATVEGNVYLPGMPSVFLPAAGGLVAQKGKAYNQSNDSGIDTSRITGREYTTEGLLADPQTDTRKIVDLYGSSTPSNYEFRATETSRVDGKVYRRADPPPVTSQKPGLPLGITLSNAPVTVTGTNTLGAGSYALTLNNTNSVLRLGSPGTITSYVFGAGSTWTGGKVEILGPVQVYFNSSTTMSGVTFGSSNTIYQTGFVVMSNYSFSIGSGGTVYGQFEARDSTLSVGNDGKFYGSAFAYEVAVSGQGYVDVSGGSDTNSVTSTNTP